MGSVSRSTVVVPTGTMLPDAALLVPVAAGGSLRSDGRAEPALREELRRIASVRNGISVALLWGQTIGLVVAARLVADAVPSPWLRPLPWVVVFVLFGRAHAQFASLMHEAAHRLLFRDRSLNDWTGRWLLGYPGFAGPDNYRRGHMAHHRAEFGPDEPDLPLYANYPITAASFRRKLVRDATGRTGWKLMRSMLRGVRSDNAGTRRTVQSILLTQAVLALACAVAGVWFVYPLWLAAFLTVWRVINRLRAVAEHGGMQASPDRRLTTHSVRQSWPARCFLVPYNIGWHLAHHVDSGVPWRNLPRYHRELVAGGYVAPGLEYPSYRALWQRLASRGVGASPAASSSSFTTGA
jgi:fatty acid desaturase